MLLYFGLALEEEPWRMPAPPWSGMFWVGPQGLLNVLESHLGLAGAQPLDEFLRIEQYRQLLSAHLSEHPDAFFAESFAADPLATATALLAYRDELLLAGWDFALSGDQPPRVRALAELETALRIGVEEGKAFSPGWADRFSAVLSVLSTRRHPVQEIKIVEPPELLPPHFRRLLAALEKTGVQLTWLPQIQPSDADTDLARFQRVLAGQGAGKTELRGDGSLLLARTRRDRDLAAWAATLLRRNPDFRPLCYISDRSRSLDNALIQEGLPSLGLLSASQARPTLQVLKLAAGFLWNPVDPFKLMEFVSLAVKPVEDGLATAIAESLAQTPGLHGEGWRIAVARYFDEAEQLAAQNGGPDPAKARKQYRFWFERKRYDSSRSAPKADAVEIFRYIEQWAKESMDENMQSNSSLPALREQARRIVELLESLPETQLGYLELERVVRTVYQSSPLQLSPREQGHLPFVTRPGALIEPVEELLWWNFIQKEPDHFFSRWYRAELAWMQARGLEVEGPALQNERLLWQRRRPVMAARKRLLLLLPHSSEGEEAPPHPLFGDLSAAFSGIERITLDVDADTAGDALKTGLVLPQKMALPRHYLGRPRPFLHILPHRRVEAREKETFTSLETLLYYPHQWVFRHKIKLVKSSILSLVKDEALMGNLAHRFFERLFVLDTSSWSKGDLERWVDQESESLLAREGAVLLLYGREPERISFLNGVKQSAWSLLHLLRENKWQVLATEQPVEGEFEGTALHGRADLVLQRGGELAVLDLKWRGIGYREDSIRNEADLQLVLYARLVTGSQGWAHSAFFIMKKARLLARNNTAFEKITPVRPGSDHIEANERILRKMQATYRWRLNQLLQGDIEVRCQQTRSELEETYSGQLLDLLEMKSDDARYDDYRVLINLVE